MKIGLTILTKHPTNQIPTSKNEVFRNRSRPISNFVFIRVISFLATKEGKDFVEIWEINLHLGLLNKISRKTSLGQSADFRLTKNETDCFNFLFDERKTGLEPATLSLGS